MKLSDWPAAIASCRHCAMDRWHFRYLASRLGRLMDLCSGPKRCEQVASRSGCGSNPKTQGTMVLGFKSWFQIHSILGGSPILTETSRLRSRMVRMLFNITGHDNQGGGMQKHPHQRRCLLLTKQLLLQVSQPHRRLGRQFPWSFKMTKGIKNVVNPINSPT